MAAYYQVCGVIHFTSPAGWLPVHGYQLRAQRSVTSMGKLYLLPFLRAVSVWCAEADAVSAPDGSDEDDGVARDARLGALGERRGRRRPARQSHRRRLTVPATPPARRGRHRTAQLIALQVSTSVQSEPYCQWRIQQFVVGASFPPVCPISRFPLLSSGP